MLAGVFTAAFAPIPAFAQSDVSDHATKAIREVIAASKSDDPFLRANAIEAMRPLPERARALINLGVDDPASVVRFAALMTAGELRMQHVEQAAKRRLNDPSQSVRAAAIYACQAAGEPVNPTPLADMLASRDPNIRANAVMVVARLGQPGSIEMIKEATRAPMRRASAEERAITRVQVAEAVVRLGDEKSLDAIRAAAYSPFDEVKVLAILTLGRLEDKAMAAALVPMLKNEPIEVRLAAARSLGQMGEINGMRTAIEGSQSDNPPVRAQAAFTLADIRHERCRDALLALLDDRSPQVRLSAAAGVIELTARQRARAQR
ncbi:MAG: HEAT repeat domain-containing protein [Phycisphaeraceae bacterium]